MALDGTKWDVPDTPANARAFGRPAAGARDERLAPGAGGGPHRVRHARRVRRRRVAPRRQRARRRPAPAALGGPGVLLTWDRGLHSFDLVVATRARRRAPARAACPPACSPEVVRTLGDGTQLVRLRPGRLGAAGRASRCSCASSPTPWTTRPGRGTGRSTASSPRCSTRAWPRPGRWSRPTTPAGRRSWPSTSWRRTSAPRAPCAAGPRWGVLQEVYGLLLAHYVVRAVMAAAAAAAAPRPLPPTRLSFLTTLRLIRTAVPELQRTAPADHPGSTASCWPTSRAAPSPRAATGATPAWSNRRCPTSA